ncbi:MAG: hypothetical protein JRN15_06640 [Nitrososphaerota archaeon]|nr:hypothetical protein [Nitrososphaerota archaeon]
MISLLDMNKFVMPLVFVTVLLVSAFTTISSPIMSNVTSAASSSSPVYKIPRSVSSNLSFQSPSFTNLVGTNSDCPVLSPFDHSCGFIENPAVWTRLYPGFDVPIDYFDGGLYGIVWLNSSAFHVIKPIMVPNAGIVPAACQVSIPSGTVLLNRTTAKLPNGQIVTLTIPSLPICASTLNQSGNDYKDVAAASTPSLSDMNANFNVPGLPYNCSDCYLYGPAIFGSDTSGTNQFFGEVATDSTCIPNTCTTYAWTLFAGYYTTSYVYDTNCPDGSIGSICHETANGGDQMATSVSIGSGYVCPKEGDGTDGNSASICISWSNAVSYVNIYMMDTNNACSDYPSTQPLYFNTIDATDQSGNVVYLTFSTSWSGTCGDYVTATNGDFATVTISYSTT